MKKMIRLLLACIVGFALFTGVAVLMLKPVDNNPMKIVEQINSRSVNEMLRYTMTRMEGHNKIEAVLLGPLKHIQSQYERPAPSMPKSKLRKGQQTKSLSPLRYDSLGHPIAAIFEGTDRVKVNNEFELKLVRVKTTSEFIRAFHAASAGQTILLSPGKYPLPQNLRTRAAGAKNAPITLRAEAPGQAILEFSSTEGLNILHPYWVVENLTMQGVCKSHSGCEHAMHIVGAASNTVIRNNNIEGFDSPIKINGDGGNWPDFGLLQFNTIANDAPRQTNYPVAFIDVVGASHWNISDNFVGNFVKDGGNYISYGIFMKGAGQGGRIERNLVVCSNENTSRRGARVGISFGGGGTGSKYCRDGSCVSEYSMGIASNNIVAHCNDAGLDANKSEKILFAHNTLINTMGVSARRQSKSIKLYGNIIEGRVFARDQSEVGSVSNFIGKASAIFHNADKLDLTWRNQPDNVLSIPSAPKDFCENPRLDGTPPGAFESFEKCAVGIQTP